MLILSQHLSTATDAKVKDQAHEANSRFGGLAEASLSTPCLVWVLG